MLPSYQPMCEHNLFEYANYINPEKDISMQEETSSNHETGVDHTKEFPANKEFFNTPLTVNHKRKADEEDINKSLLKKICKERVCPSNQINLIPKLYEDLLPETELPKSSYFGPDIFDSNSPLAFFRNSSAYELVYYFFKNIDNYDFKVNTESLKIIELIVFKYYSDIIYESNKIEEESLLDQYKINDLILSNINKIKDKFFYYFSSQNKKSPEMQKMHKHFAEIVGNIHDSILNNYSDTRNQALTNNSETFPIHNMEIVNEQRKRFIDSEYKKPIFPIEIVYKIFEYLPSPPYPLNVEAQRFSLQKNVLNKKIRPLVSYGCRTTSECGAFIKRFNLDILNFETDYIKYKDEQYPLLNLNESFIQQIPVMINGATKIYLKNQKFNENAFKYFSRLDHLQELDLENCSQVSDVGVKYLSKVNQLRLLNLSGCNKITDKGLSQLNTSLVHLNLSYCRKISNKGLEHVGKLFQLKHLNLKFCDQISGVGINYLSDLNLTELNLKKCSRINSDDLKHLSKMQLVKLELGFCHRINSDGIAFLKQHPLKTLDLKSCNQITEIGLQHLEGMSISSLTLKGCHRITGRGFLRLSSLSSLTSLNLSDLPGLSDLSLGYLNKLPITSLNLSGCNNITAKGFERLFEFKLIINNPLKSLNIAGCEKMYSLYGIKCLLLTSLNVKGLKIFDNDLSFLKDMPLTTLNLSNCLQITGDGLKELKACPLTSLDLSGCSNILRCGHLVVHSKRMTSLNLSRMNIPDNDRIFSIIWDQLRFLSMAGCQKISGIRSLIFPSLTSLDLTGCDHFCFNDKEGYLSLTNILKNNLVSKDERNVNVEEEVLMDQDRRQKEPLPNVTIDQLDQVNNALYKALFV